MTNEVKKKLQGYLLDIKRNELVVYGESSHVIKEVNLGSGERLEIHYYEDGNEIQEAFFSSSGGAKIALSQNEIELLSQRF